MPDFSVEDRGLYDIQRFKWSGFKPNGHPAEKPVLLCKWLIGNGCLSGDLILDPFCGSGTTLVAAKMLGRRYIGIDIEKKYCDIAEERLRNTTPPLPFAETRKQEQGCLL
jgi:DNA modification methylase